MKTNIAALLWASLLSISVARADEAVPSNDPAVPDAVLAAMKGQLVIVTTRDGHVLTGTPLSFDAQSLVLIEDITRRAVALPRVDVVTVCLQSMPSVQALPPLPPMVLAARHEKVRHIGLQLSQGPGNVMLDAEYGHFYGFIGTSIGYPIIFSGSDGPQYFSVALGLGGTWKMGPRSNWHFDLMGTVTPTWWGGFSAGIGVSAGFHYTSPNGITVGIKIPIIGAAPGCNTIFNDSGSDSGSGSGCQISSGASLLGNYYLQAAMSQPLVSVGYRF